MKLKKPTGIKEIIPEKITNSDGKQKQVWKENIKSEGSKER